MPYSNPEKEREYQLQWRKRNPDYHRKWRKKQRAKGRCIDCVAKAVDGSSRCRRHIELRRSARGDLR